MSDNQIIQQKGSNAEQSINMKDVFFLINKYQEFNNGVTTTDICQLFSFWQTHFGTLNQIDINSDDADGRNQLMQDDKQMWLNYNSKSFNNKTYFGNEQTSQNQREFSLEEGSPKQHLEFEKNMQLNLGHNQFSVNNSQKKINFADEKIEEVHSPIHIEEKQANMDEQFSFDKDFNFNPDENNKEKQIDNELQSHDMSEIIDQDEKNLVNDLNHRFDITQSMYNPLQLSRVCTFQLSQDKLTEDIIQFKIGTVFQRPLHVVSEILKTYHYFEVHFKYWQSGIYRRYFQTFMIFNSMRNLAYLINVNYFISKASQEQRTRIQSKYYSALESPQKLSELIHMSDISPIIEKKHKTNHHNDDGEKHQKQRKQSKKKSAVRLTFLSHLLNKSNSLIKSIRQVIKCALIGRKHLQVVRYSSFINTVMTTVSYQNHQGLIWNTTTKKQSKNEVFQHYIAQMVARLRECRQDDQNVDAIDLLSSIQSADKDEEMEDRDVLQTFHQAKVRGLNLKRNDDLEYKQREIRNLSKFRDKSQVSNKSEFGILKIDQLNDILSQKSREHQKSKEKRHRGKSHKEKGNAGSSRHKSQLSKSKSRFSNQMGFNNLQNVLANELDALENTQDIEKLLNEIDNDQFELEQFISKEEEEFQKKVIHKLDQGEQEINTRREGSNQRGPDSFRQHNLYASKEYGQTQRILLSTENYNQHHNNISNNSGSFYFNMSKKIIVPGDDRGEERKKSPSQNPYLNNLEPGLDKQSSNSETCTSQSSEQSQSQNKMKLQHEIFSKSTNVNQNSQLLTDRPNLETRLELGRFKNKIGQDYRQGLNIAVEKSNERGISVVSANSIGQGMGGDSRYMLNNLSAINTSNNQNTYHSLSRVGIKKISSGYSNQSPQHRQNFISQQRMGNPNRNKHTINLQNTQKSYKSLTPIMAQQTSKNPVLLRLQTNQKQRGQSSHNSINMHTIGPEVSQGGAAGDISHRHGATIQNGLGVSLNSIITPKSFKTSGAFNLGAIKNQSKSKNEVSSFNENKEAKPKIKLDESGGAKVLQLGTQGSVRKAKKMVQPVLKKIDLQQALREKSSKEKSIESIDAELVDSQNVSMYCKEKYSLNSSTNMLMKFKLQKEKTSMNQSITKLSERLRNNSSTSSIGGTSRSKLKQKFKPANSSHKHQALTTKNSIIKKQSDNLQNMLNQGNNKVNATLQSNEIRRDRNSRVGNRVVQGASAKMQTNVIQLKVQNSPQNESEQQYLRVTEGNDGNVGSSSKSKLKQPSLNTSAVNRMTRADALTLSQKQSAHHSQYSNSVMQQQQQQLSQSARTHTEAPQNNLRACNNLKGQSSKQQSFGLYPFHKQQKQSVKSSNFVSEYSDQNQFKMGIDQLVNQGQTQSQEASAKFDRSRYSAQIYQDNKDRDHHQQMIQQSYYAAAQTERNPSNPQDNFFSQQHQTNMNRSQIKQEADGGVIYPEHQEPVRLVELLISELKRKKGKNIQTDYDKTDQLNVLLNFWRDSLTRDRILHKLKIKQHQSYQNQKANVTNTSSINYKLSDKEIYLLNYLEGTDKQPLLQLGKESTTRNYGELATIPETLLCEHIAQYLGLEIYEGDISNNWKGDQSSYHMPQPSIGAF